MYTYVNELYTYNIPHAVPFGVIKADGVCLFHCVCPFCSFLKHLLLDPLHLCQQKHIYDVLPHTQMIKSVIIMLLSSLRMRPCCFNLFCFFWVV